MINWLISSGIGILFATLPVSTWCNLRIYKSVIYEKLPVKNWIVSLFCVGDQAISNLRFRITFIIVKVLSVFYILGWLIFYEFKAGTYFMPINAINIILFQTSFPIFFLASFILPVFFVERYLKQIKREQSANLNSTDKMKIK